MNPIPRHGGATCQGPSTQTKPCNMAAFEGLPGSGINGHDDAYYTVTSLQGCIDRCKVEHQFTCKSFEYIASLQRCILSRVDRHGGQLVTGPTFANTVYFERKCKPNTVQTVTLRKVPGFSDNCDTQNCYHHCGESPYINKVLNASVVNLRFLRFDLVNLPKIIGNNKPDKVVVQAQTIILSKNVEVSYDLVLVARQVKLGSNHMVYKGQAVTSCVNSNPQHDCSVYSHLRLISFYGHGRMDIYTESFNGPTCPEGRKISKTPAIDVTALRAALACAEDLAMSSTSGHTQVAYNIAHYVQHMSHDTSGFPSTSVALSVRSAAVKLTSYMDTRKKGLRPVPILSQKTYSDMLSSYHTIFAVYHLKYDNIFANAANIENQVKDLKAAVSSAEDAYGVQVKKREFAGIRVQESASALKKINEQLQVSKNTLAEAKVAFDDGLNKYKEQQNIKAGFEFAQIAGQIVSAAAGVAGVAKGDSKGVERIGEFIESGTDLVTSVLQIGSYIHDIYELSLTFSSINSWSTGVDDAVKAKSTPTNAKDVMESAQAVADARAKVVSWDDLKMKGDSMLTPDPMPEVNGCIDYLKALSDMCEWGKAYTEQILDHADLVNDYIVESLAADAAKVEVDEMKRLLTTAATSHASLQQLQKDVSDEVIEVLLSALRLTTDFSKAFFYYNLREIEATQRLHLSDMLTHVREKLSGLSQAPLLAAHSFGSKPPEPFSAHYVLKDKVTTGCTDPVECPITFLKTGKPLLINISMSATNLQGLDRVRVEEIRMFINTPTFNSHAKYGEVFFDHTGEMSDRFNNHVHHFVVNDRRFTFKYDYEIHQTLTHACVASSVSQAYHQMTPFGKWVIQLHNLEQSLNLQSITSVEIYYIGSAIPNGQLRKAESNLRFKKQGEADRSSQCAGSGRITKRSLLSGARTKGQ